MNFQELAEMRQSCRSYDPTKDIEDEKLNRILNCSILAPSACNGQPYKITVCRGEAAKQVAKATMGMGMNKFTVNAPVMVVISEDNYVASAAFGAKLKGNDYRSIDIGILSAYITAQATCEGIGSCILGWFDDNEIRKICKLDKPPRLVISLGYPDTNDKLRQKKRKSLDSICNTIT